MIHDTHQPNIMSTESQPHASLSAGGADPFYVSFDASSTTSSLKFILKKKKKPSPFKPPPVPPSLFIPNLDQFIVQSYAEGGGFMVGVYDAPQSSQVNNTSPGLHIHHQTKQQQQQQACPAVSSSSNNCSYANRPKCSLCASTIVDEECTEAEGGVFHIKCFACVFCQTPLGGLQYIMHSNNNDVTPTTKSPYCTTCFDSLFGEYCEGCGDLIHVAKGSAISHESRSWHATDACFRCYFCLKSLLGLPFLPHSSGFIFCSIRCSKLSLSSFDKTSDIRLPSSSSSSTAVLHQPIQEGNEVCSSTADDEDDAGDKEDTPTALPPKSSSLSFLLETKYPASKDSPTIMSKSSSGGLDNPAFQASEVVVTSDEGETNRTGQRFDLNPSSSHDNHHDFGEKGDSATGDGSASSEKGDSAGGDGSGSSDNNSHLDSGNKLPNSCNNINRTNKSKEIAINEQIKTPKSVSFDPETMREKEKPSTVRRLRRREHHHHRDREHSSSSSRRSSSSSRHHHHRSKSNRSCSSSCSSSSHRHHNHHRSHRESSRDHHQHHHDKHRDGERRLSSRKVKRSEEGEKDEGENKDLNEIGKTNKCDSAGEGVTETTTKSSSNASRRDARDHHRHHHHHRGNKHHDSSHSKRNKKAKKRKSSTQDSCSSCDSTSSLSEDDSCSSCCSSDDDDEYDSYSSSCSTCSSSYSSSSSSSDSSSTSDSDEEGNHAVEWIHPLKTATASGINGQTMVTLTAQQQQHQQQILLQQQQSLVSIKLPSRGKNKKKIILSKEEGARKKGKKGLSLSSSLSFASLGLSSSSSSATRSEGVTTVVDASSFSSSFPSVVSRRGRNNNQTEKQKKKAEEEESDAIPDESESTRSKFQDMSLTDGNRNKKIEEQEGDDELLCSSSQQQQQSMMRRNNQERQVSSCVSSIEIGNQDQREDEEEEGVNEEEEEDDDGDEEEVGYDSVYPISSSSLSVRQKNSQKMSVRQPPLPPHAHHFMTSVPNSSSTSNGILQDVFVRGPSLSSTGGSFSSSSRSSRPDIKRMPNSQCSIQ